MSDRPTEAELWAEIEKLKAIERKFNSLSGIANDFDDASEDAEWEPPHPIFMMAQDVDNLNAKNKELTKLLAEERKKAVPEWMPIETAPMDGAQILVGFGRQSGFPVKVVFYNVIHKFWSHYGEAMLGLEQNATHWMPIIKPDKKCSDERPCINCFSDQGICLGAAPKIGGG